MVDIVKKANTHPKNIPAAAYCCWHVGYLGGGPSFSLWAEFQLFQYWDRKYFIEKNMKRAKTHS
jgi:hypothetical protein